jgi:GT2 family glycosyltransferase
LLSIVIPTKDRVDVLGRTLDALGGQRRPSGGFEVLVVENGSSDRTSSMVARRQQSFPVPLHLLSEPKPGPAAARNRGVSQAVGEIVLFLGDDMIPADPELVAGHARLHGRQTDRMLGVLGRVEWHPEEPRTPFMRWLETQGPQFDFRSLDPGPVSPATHFVTANVSVKRDVLIASGGFDERFPYAALEDVELGRRLAASGVVLDYAPQLLVHHVHPTTLADSLERMVKVGRSAALFHRIHPGSESPELPLPHRELKSLLFRPVAPLAGRAWMLEPLRHRAWSELHVAAYERGYGDGPPPVSEEGLSGTSTTKSVR